MSSLKLNSFCALKYFNSFNGNNLVIFIVMVQLILFMVGMINSTVGTYICQQIIYFWLSFSNEITKIYILFH